jgi:NAD(P)-dependent dehydrogenase (short-subunit alcohol dehydrogenase family)
MEISLSDKVVVVTGGTKGLGRAVAENAGKSGAKIVISGRNKKDGEDVVNIIKTRYKSDAYFAIGCLKNVDNCKKLIKTAIDKFGRIDGLVNYAGVTSTARIYETTEYLFNNIFEINFKASFFCSKYAIKEMLPTGGSIVNIGSTHAYSGDIIRAAYGCSKGAMLTLSKHIANNYSRYKIRSNFITMGWSATPNEIKLYNSWGYTEDELNKKGSETIPMGRLQVNEDFVPAVLYLLSDFSSHLTGSEIHINGGFWPAYGE